MHYKSTALSDKVFRVCNVVILTTLMLMALYPCLYVVFASFSNPVELYVSQSKLLWGPKGFSTMAYEITLQNARLWTAYGNTFLYVISGTVLSVFFSVMGGYVLSRRYLPGRVTLTFIITFTMFFSGGLIPTFLIVRTLKLYNTFGAMIIPSMINTMNVIYIMSYCRSIPDEMEESAKVDGANDWDVFWRIMVPLSVPIIAVITLYYAVGIWNSYIAPTIYLMDRKLFPLQVLLREILISEDELSMNITTTSDSAFQNIPAYKETIKFTTIIISMVPVLILYPFIQRFFIRGVMLGAIKG